MTGRSGRTSCMRAASSSPVKSGIEWSVITRSKAVGSAEKSLHASLPLVTDRASYPSFESIRLPSSASSRWSSTTSTDRAPLISSPARVGGASFTIGRYTAKPPPRPSGPVTSTVPPKAPMMPLAAWSPSPARPSHPGRCWCEVRPSSARVRLPVAATVMCAYGPGQRDPRSALALSLTATHVLSTVRRPSPPSSA